MEVKRFNLESDFKKLEDYLRNQYMENKNMTSWLPERLNDLVFRMDTQYIEAGDLKSSDYIFIWEDNNEIVGCILPDGDAIYISIKKGYEDLYKSIVNYAEEKNDVCSYCFVYVDKKSKTAFVEPVSTREKYRHKGIGTAMMHGVILKCKELGIEKCYVNSYDWRRKFYNASGFTTEDTIGFYHKKI